MTAGALYVGLDLGTSSLKGVVLDADGLSSQQMQAIAREFNISETVFVLPPRLPATVQKRRSGPPAR